MTRPDERLDPVAIRRAAEMAAGTDDWDDADIREPLDILADALAGEARLHDLGRSLVGERLRNMLTAYIKVQGDARRSIEILDQRIDSPIILFGLPRSGTTMLHGLLAADPQNRAPRWWEALRPSPPPSPDLFGTDPRRAEVQAELDDQLRRSPSLRASLAYSADLTAECNTITQVALRSQAFHSYYRTPTYARWLLDADQSPMFRYHRRALQQLQWLWPARRWVLKAPPHKFNLAELVAAYPDAKLIMNHRDPKDVMASGCGLQAALRRPYSDAVDKHELGADYLELQGVGCERADAFRAAHPEVPIIDVFYDELIADPLGVIERIYAALGMALSSDARGNMEAWLVENAREKRPVEHYDLAHFGLSPGQVDERFGRYMANHDL